MGIHVEQLGLKIAEAQAEVNRLTAETEQVKADLGALLASDGNNEKAADRLQQRREELSRAKERAEIRLEALKKEMPAAERLDAQARLNAILGEATALSKVSEQARADYLAALKTLQEAVEPAFSPAVRMINLKSEASYWSGAFNCLASPFRSASHQIPTP